MRLRGRVAVITGAGRGIGRAIAERFAREGAAVFLASRSGAQLEEAAKVIRDAGGRAEYLAADVSLEEDARRVTESANQRLGPINILVNNAGVLGPMKAIAETAAEEWDRVMAVNLRSAFLMTRAVLPGMIERKKGVILNISSNGAKQAHQLSSAYAASKAAMIVLARVAASEAGRAGVRVNSLCPGAVEGTEMWEAVGAGVEREFGLSREEFLKQAYGSTQLGRPQTLKEIAGCAAFLCSDDASGITGQAVNTDGGTVFY